MSTVMGLLSVIWNGVTTVGDGLAWLGRFLMKCTPAAWIVGVGSSVAIAGTCTALGWMGMDKALDALDSIGAEVDSLASMGSGADGGILSQVNYVFPVNELAACMVVYLSVWVAVQSFKLWMKLMAGAASAVEKIPGQ